MSCLLTLPNLQPLLQRYRMGGASSPIGRPLHTQEQSAAADQKETVLREKEDAFYFSEKQVKVREAGSLYFYSMFLFLPPSLNSCA